MLFTDVSSQRALRALKKAGFAILRSGKHSVLTDGTRLVTVPRHNRLNPYTLRSIIRDAGLTDQAFRELLG